MLRNLIVVAGLSHSGKDLLFNHLMKLGRNEPNLRIFQNVVYYDWLNPPPKSKEGSYITKLISPIREKIFVKTNTLIYVHDISYQRIDDIIADFQRILTTLSDHNKNFQVILILNRGHLIPNEIERNKIQKEVTNRIQQIFHKEVPSYVISLKGPDEQRRTNLIMTQIMHKAYDYSKQRLETQIELDKGKIKRIQKILNEKMGELNFSGAYLISPDYNVLVAVGKSQGWREKVGPQIIRMLAQDGAFNLAPKVKTSLSRIEDYLMATLSLNFRGIKIVLIGREGTFMLDNESFSAIEQICSELTFDISSKL
ncbi:MAG: hypothetical protein ACFFAU_03645 [Candidatus Hodarchaeota archaeon]